MDIDPTTLFLIWFGGGCVVFLAWAALVGQAVMGERPGAVRPAIGVLAVVGVLHPAAAVSAIDLVRLSRSFATPVSDGPVAPSVEARARALALPAWAPAAVGACAALSAVVAVGVFIQAGGLP